MRQPAALLMSVLALAMAPGAASAGELRGLRLVQSDTGTRAELRLDSDADVRMFQLHDPDRLVVDLPSTRMAPGFRLPGANGAVSSLRTGQPTPGTLRVVFDLGIPVTSAHRFESGPDGRVLVVDLVSPGSNPSQAMAAMPSTAAAPPAFVAPSRSTPSIAATTTRGNATSRDTNLRSDMRRWSQADVSSVAVPLRDDDTAADEPDAAQILAGVQTQANFAPVDPVPVDAPRDDPSPAIAAPITAPIPSVPAAIGRDMALAPPAARSRAPSKTMLDVIGRGQRKLIVAIDAGHGGKDPGAHGPTGVREKVVTLAVARELARQINADPGMRAVLIRDGDEFVALGSRYMKARAAQADLFISIHADASPNDSATGASVFVLSTRGASSQAARWLADSENAADLVGGVSLDSRDHKLAAVLLDLSQSATMRASDDVAQQVLGSLKNVGKAHKQAIERANFVVLRSPDVPSMLVETGFITNPGEEQRLNDPGYRARLAAAITDGVRRYFVGQPPPGTWYAARGEAAGAGDGGVTQVASAPD